MEKQEKQEKKPYTPPTITEHGDARKLTRGTGGRFWELYMSKYYSDLEWDD